MKTIVTLFFVLFFSLPTFATIGHSISSLSPFEIGKLWKSVVRFHVGSNSCTGTFVSPTQLLTASHCLPFNKDLFLELFNSNGHPDYILNIKAGDYKTHSLSQYYSNYFRYDIAVIEFNQAILKNYSSHGPANFSSIFLPEVQNLNWALDDLSVPRSHFQGYQPLRLQHPTMKKINNHPVFVVGASPNGSDLNTGDQGLLTVYSGYINGFDERKGIGILPDENSRGTCFGDSGGLVLAVAGDKLFLIGVIAGVDKSYKTEVGNYHVSNNCFLQTFAAPAAVDFLSKLQVYIN